ncbi:mammaglobin-A-like [Lepus europaeus]|uniref:mammaglobin-A-like n=1 Tax=Lepus europaeus TaxID=9983 RepID=UPI002B48E6A4|nr:mammaglobin-A-like [Lepus europaeus]
MKCVIVLMLAALPLYCYAGSGCQLMDDMVTKTLDSEISVTDYHDFLKNLSRDAAAEMAVKDFKQCFLMQSNETLNNIKLFLDFEHIIPFFSDL